MINIANDFCFIMIYTFEFYITKKKNKGALIYI